MAESPAPRSLRSINGADPGYRPSPAFEKLLDNADIAALIESINHDSGSTLREGAAGQLFEAYVRDVLDQYTATYYADDDPGTITIAVQRLAQLSVPIALMSEMDDFLLNPTGIEAMFDDVIQLDGETFSAKYGILDFYNMVREDLESKPPPNKYILLAAHLNPANPDDGRHQIDQFLLEAHQSYDRRRNRWLATSKLSFVAATLCAFLGAGPMMTKFMIPAADLGKSPAYLQYIASISWATILLLFTAYVLLVMLQMKTRWPDHIELAAPRGDMRAWFEARDLEPSMRHWVEAYWPSAKLYMHRRRRFGLTFWRDTLASRTDYEAEVERLERTSRHPHDWRRALRHLLDHASGDYP